MDIKPLDAPFGCEVIGLDINKGVSAEAFKPIRAAFEEYSVVVIRGEPLSDETQIAFSEHFGPCEKTLTGNPAAGSAFARQSNIDMKTGESIPLDDRRMFYQVANMMWHADSAFKPRASLCSMLSAREIPSTGGNTEVASTRLAYAALTSAQQAEIEDLYAEYSLVWSRGLIGYQFTEHERATMHRVQHKMVRANPANGAKSMLLGAHADHIIGWGVDRGRALLGELLAHSTRPEFCLSHTWRDGDVLIWDNRACLHRATPYDAGAERRLMQRTTIADQSDEALDPTAVAA
jgi:alpha-ketoglutarate-dependent 2,4-dichlorophenoxyacetate dioxygenase